ncbi:4-coumarate--CoA ligase 1-like [Bradysia coprophila]|uniref:4-coumarate--CoA ligase 1-like n=1 Tax=Bradysia coprophila TaxID=38358 RepID=UPI00187DB788|nr:4-coumarate--CoA ligase 1-like [Bradysia coprophila]
MQFERNIIHRPKRTTLYDDAPSLGHILIHSLKTAGNKPMIVCGVTGQTLSGIELLSKSITIAKALLAAGIKQGDVISVVSESRFDYVYVLFGTIFINCVLAPLNHAYSASELRHALSFSKPRVIFTGGSVADGIIEIGKTLNYVEKVICFDDRANSPPCNLVVNLSDFTDSQTIRNVKFEPLAVDVIKTACLIMCSSGTTGFPKGVQLSQSGIIATASNMNEFVFKDLNVGDKETVILGLLPMFHVFGSLVLICTIANRSGKLIMLPKFEETTFLRSFEKYRCTVAFLVPPLMVFLAKHPLVDRYDLSSLEAIICGAAPISKELEQSVKDRLRTDFRIKQMYGMTELTSVVLLQKDIKKPGSVGDANENVYAKVVDVNGTALGPNQIGELCFKGTLVMMGYISDTQATSAIIDEDGWLHTGDVGYYDEDLQFFIIDRIKELIKWKGFQVPPAELEAVLLSHPKIKDCGVVGKPDEYAGELPLAFVVKGDPQLTEADIVKYVYGKMSPAKRLHGGVIFIDEIPKNPSGKILRRELRKLLAEQEFKSKL